MNGVNYEILKSYDDLIQKVPSQQENQIKIMKKYIKDCLQNGVKLNAVIESVNGDSVLHLAARDGRFRVMQILLDADAGADLDLPNRYEKTARAILESKHPQLLKLFPKKSSKEIELVTATPVPSTFSSTSDQNDNRAPFFNMVEIGDLMAIRKLLEEDQGIILESDYDGRNCCHIAAIHGNYHLFDFFAHGGAPMHEMDKNKRIPLHHAAIHGYENVIRVLIRWGCNGGPDKNGMTPALLAAQQGHLNIVKILMGKAPLIASEIVSETRQHILHIATIAEKTAVLVRSSLFQQSYKISGVPGATAFKHTKSAGKKQPASKSRASAKKVLISIAL